VPSHARAKTAVPVKNESRWVGRVAHALSQSRYSPQLIYFQEV
jgi:hypothetical protein